MCVYLFICQDQFSNFFKRIAELSLTVLLLSGTVSNIFKSIKKIRLIGANPFMYFIMLLIDLSSFPLSSAENLLIGLPVYTH